MNVFARTLLAGTTAALLGGIAIGAEQQSAQSLLERGSFAEATQRAQQEREAGNNDPATAFVSGQAFVKMDQGQQAREEFARLSGGDDETWKAIGQSSIALIDGNLDEALNEANRARDINGESGFAHYQVGLVQLRRSDWDGASQAFDRATELMPNFAYAFYNGGVAHQRAKRYNQMAERFRTFMQLAPDAPEKGTVQLALSALRG